MFYCNNGISTCWVSRNSLVCLFALQPVLSALLGDTAAAELLLSAVCVTAVVEERVIVMQVHQPALLSV
jgi:hypothetical protein